MAQIKIRIVINKGRTGAPLEKLSGISRQIDRFMRSLVSDLDLEPKKGELLAMNFKNSSVAFDTALQVEVTESKLRSFNRCIEFIVDYDPETDGANGLVSDATLLEFSKIGECIDPDEEVGLGIYAPGYPNKPKKWRQVTYRKASRIRQALEQPVSSYGSIQGLLYSLADGAAQPFFQVKESATERIVKCFYAADLYPEIVGALSERKPIVYASGYLQFDRASREVEQMKVERIDKVERLTDAEFNSLFGSVPNLTGALTTNEFIRSIRDDG